MTTTPDVDAARRRTLIAAAESSSTASDFARAALRRADDKDADYALVLAAIAVVHELHALTLTLEAATLEPADTGASSTS